MDWTTSLRSQQADFIQRIQSNPESLLRWGRGKHGELKVIPPDILKQLREFSWLMVDKYKNTKATAREVFSNQLKGKLGEEVTKECLGVFYYRIKYDTMLNGDGKVELTLTNNQKIGIRVKTSYGQGNKISWLLNPEQVEQNKVFVCVLLPQDGEGQDFDEFKSEYSPIMAGFLPTALINRMVQKGELETQLVNGNKLFKLTLKHLLYGGGLRSYLESLDRVEGEKTKKDKLGVAKDRESEKPNNPNLAQSYYNRGVGRYQKGDKQGAIEDYSKAIKHNPKFIQAYYNRGVARYQMRNYQGAIEDWGKTISLNPNIAQAYYSRGVARSELGNYQGALADYNKAIDLNPNHAKAYYNRGIVRSEMGKYQAAIGDWTGAIALDPKFAKAYYNRGNARFEMGDIQGSVEDYTKAIKINPNFTQAEEKLQLARSKLE